MIHQRSYKKCCKQFRATKILGSHSIWVCTLIVSVYPHCTQKLCHASWVHKPRNIKTDYQIMSLGKVIKGWWSMLVSTATLRVVTTRYHHTDRVSGDVFHHVCLPTPVKGREAREQKYAISRYGTQIKLHLLTQPVNKTHKITCTSHSLSRNTTHRQHYFMCM